MDSRSLRVVPLMMVVSLLVASCTTSGHRPTPAPTSTGHPPPKLTTGVIAGTGSPCVGPAAPSAHYAVPVKLIDAANASQIQDVEAPYRFRFVVQPGTYTLSEPGARPVTVHIVAGQTVDVHLVAGCR